MKFVVSTLLTVLCLFGAIGAAHADENGQNGGATRAEMATPPANSGTGGASSGNDDSPSVAIEGVRGLVIGAAKVGQKFWAGRAAVGSGRSVAAGRAILDVVSGAQINVESGNLQSHVEFSPQGDTLATGGYGKIAKLWSVSTGELIREFAVGGTDGALTPVFSPDGTLLASSSADRSVGIPFFRTTDGMP